MSTTEELRNDIRNAFNQGKKYLLTIKVEGLIRTLYGEAPSILGAFVVEHFGEMGIEAFTRGDANIYEIRNDHPHRKDGWFIHTVPFSVSVN